MEFRMYRVLSAPFSGPQQSVVDFDAFDAPHQRRTTTAWAMIVTFRYHNATVTRLGCQWDSKLYEDVQCTQQHNCTS